MKQRLYIGLSLLLVLLLATTATAAEVGGEVKTKTITAALDDNSFTTIVQNFLTVELLIPQGDKTSAYAEMDLQTPPAGEGEGNPLLPNGELISEVKKLYLKHKFDKFDISVGRQPISWSFGSLLNPVDYNLGAEAMEQTGSAKYVDAVETYYPINWNTSVTAVTSLTNGTVIDKDGDQIPDGRDKVVKYGLRGRTLVKDYDVTLNYVQQAGGKKQRVGATAKGDLGPISVYGAGSYYFDSDQPVYLVGTDYSFFPGRGNNRLMFQLEYLKDETGVVSSILSNFGTEADAIPQKIDLVLGMTSYDINDFSSIKLIGLYYPEDSSGMISPEYNNQLGSGLQFNCRASWFVGSKQDTLGPQQDPTTGKTVNGNLEMELSYLF